MTNDGPDDVVCNAARGGLGFIIARDEVAQEGQDKQRSVCYTANMSISDFLLTPKVNVVQKFLKNISVHYYCLITYLVKLLIGITAIRPKKKIHIRR